MNRVLTSADMALVEDESERLGVTRSQLMENAGAALARIALLRVSDTGRFAVVCGPGNNGGDGLVAARHLAQRGRSVAIWRPGSAPSLPFHAQKGDVVIDAIFGTGLGRRIAGDYEAAISQIARWREAGAVVVAADVPSGVNADNDQRMGAAVTADVTACFGALKLGLLMPSGRERCGHVELVDIGIPEPAFLVLKSPSICAADEAAIKALIAPRRSESHKGTYGHVLIAAGAQGKTGASALAAMAALRAGAGLVTVLGRSSVIDSVLRHAPELMGQVLPGEGPLALSDVPALLEALNGKTALVIGPGLWVGPETGAAICLVVASSTLRCVLDADGLNALGSQIERLRVAQQRLAITPHPGEMSRLLGISIDEVQGDRLGAARRCADRSGATVILKGASSVIAAPDGSIALNPTGNAGMATAGTGDVLSGILGAFLCRSMTVPQAAMAACFVHGLAGDLAAKRVGQNGLVASDVISSLGSIWHRWGR